MGYHTQQKPVGKFDFSKMKTKTMEKKVVIKVKIAHGLIRIFQRMKCFLNLKIPIQQKKNQIQVDIEKIIFSIGKLI